MKIKSVASATVLITLVTTACSSGGSTKSPPVKTETRTTTVVSTAPAPTAPSSDDATGSVIGGGSVARFPGGLSATISKVQKISSDRCYEAKKTDTCVLVQAQITNSGSAPAKVKGTEGAEPELTLLAGADQYELESATYTDDPGSPDVPRQLVAGSKCIIGATFAVPAARIGVLAAELKMPIDNTEPYLFDGLEKKLK